MALGLFLALCSHRLSCYHSIFDCFVLIAPLDFVLLAELHLDFVPIAVHPIVIVDLVAPKTRPCLQISKKYEKVRYEKKMFRKYLQGSTAPFSYSLFSNGLP